MHLKCIDSTLKKVLKFFATSVESDNMFIVGQAYLYMCTRACDIVNMTCLMDVMESQE